MNKGIILYDFLIVKGGAETLTLSLLKEMPDTDLCVAFKDDEIFPDEALSFVHIKTLTGLSRILGWQSIKSIFAFAHQTRFLKEYDWVLYSGNNAPVAVKNHSKGRNILYCHTPPRFVYDLKEHYLQQASWWQKPLLKLLSAYVKYHYEKSIIQMDLIIANSDNVRNRIKHYLGRDAIVINPPIDVDHFNWIEQGDFYLSVARVESYKRVELIIRSFMNMPDKKLLVASGGSDLERLKNLAKEYTNITFSGWCDDQQLRNLVGSCIATIYIPPDEDFGMSPVESMSAGKPVIGVAEGGLLETVIHEKTGILIPAKPDEKLLIEAVNSMTPERALEMREACEERAQLFRSELFIKKMKAVLL